ncbi:autotransporter outer membrane beta-barrel domain-containing protein, partial [Synergistaceae bacterium OttesenSCG-928-D05]|nr:autotransporter outer membrane beta-barrel domain-containing protein [Synergistaceae bacterium OttesenSCG-928-D05]
ASIYTVYKQESGFYLSGLAKFNHYDTDLTVGAVDKLSRQLGYDKIEGGLNQRGLGMSLLAGKRFVVGEKGWYWEPQAQFSYMRIFGDKYLTSSGLDVDVEATTSLRARAGFLFGKAIELKNGSVLDVFADVSINKEFDGETDIWMSGGKYTRDLGDTWGSYGLGFSWRMGERSYLGGRIAYGSGSDRTEPISATLGLLFELQ